MAQRKMTAEQADGALRALGYKPKNKVNDDDGNYETSMQTFIDGDMIRATSPVSSNKPQSYKDLVGAFDTWTQTDKIKALWAKVKLEVVDAKKTFKNDDGTKRIATGTKKYIEFCSHFVSEFTENVIPTNGNVEKVTEEVEKVVADETK